MSTATTTTTTQTTSSSVPNAGTKISKFAAKAGFVIPKNKLSGSLVPVIRGGKKPGKNDPIDEEEKVSKVQRKTKWGNDLTLDSAVRRGRALAYQSRVDQIVQQLESGSLEVKDNQDSEGAAQKSSNPQVDREKLEHLELEKREAIGEILELNPNYKAPPEYKPLLKEAIVPIPVKEYRGYNFLGLIFGPASDTQKRLEKETGAIIKVYGTKADTGEEVEISTSDGNVQDAYEELYINISAETYEKVDAAADLIELLVTAVSGSLAAISTPTSVPGANVNVLSQSQGEGDPFMVPNRVVNPGVALMVGPMQTPPQGQFQDQIPWLPSGLPQNPMHPVSSSAPMLTNPINMPSLFGPRPGTAAGFPSIHQTPSPVPPGSQPQMPALPRPYMPQVHSGPPRNFPMSAPHPMSVQSDMGSLHFTGIQPQPTGPFAVGKPSMPSLPQSVSNFPPQPLSDGLLTPANASASLASSNMGQLIQGPRPLISQAGVAPPAPPNISAANMVSPASFPSRASTSAMNLPPGPIFASGPAPLVGSSPSFPASIRPTQVPGSAPLPVPSMSRPTIQAGIAGSVSGSITNFSSINSSSATAPRPQLPSSGDFTFQPHQPQNFPPLTVPRPSGMLNTPPPRPMAQLLAPQAPQPIMQVPRAQFGNQMGQPQVHTSAVPFVARNPNAAFANASPVSPAVPLQMGPRNFGPSPQMPYSAGPFPSRPGNPLPRNYPAPTNRPQSHVGVNQQYSNNRAGGPQIYDPFSPTSVSIPPQQQGAANPVRVRKPENDPEYEDLMASVGVK